MKRIAYLLFFFFTVSVPAINAQNSSVTSKSNEMVNKKSEVTGDTISFYSVYQPVLSSSNTKVMDWVVKNYANGVPVFRYILMSMTANYSLFIPTDEALAKYIDPIAFSKDVPGVLKYWYNSSKTSVYATMYKYDKQTGAVGDSVGVVSDATFILNRLVDILNSHIVVGDVQSGKSFYMTRGNVPLKIEGSGSSMTVQQGGNIKLNEKANITRIFNQANGNTYFIDKPLQSPLTSVYKTLNETPEFGEFFSLLVEFQSPLNTEIFVRKTGYFGIDYNIPFFKTFNYTVYVPTNAAILDAIDRGIITPWISRGKIVGIFDMIDETAKAAAISKLERFLRYHFQDNSVFIDNQSINKVYQSATIKNNDVNTHFGTYKNKFYKIGVSGNGSDLMLTTETGKTARVVTTNGLYNIMARDYIFSANPLTSTFKNIDGTGTGALFDTSRIYTSSTAVIHQIDSILVFE